MHWPAEMGTNSQKALKFALHIQGLCDLHISYAKAGRRTRSMFRKTLDYGIICICNNAAMTCLPAELEYIWGVLASIAAHVATYKGGHLKQYLAAVLNVELKTFSLHYENYLLSLALNWTIWFQFWIEPWGVICKSLSTVNVICLGHNKPDLKNSKIIISVICIQNWLVEISSTRII